MQRQHCFVAPEAIWFSLFLDHTVLWQTTVVGATHCEPAVLPDGRLRKRTIVTNARPD